MNFILKILYIFLKNNYDDSYILRCYLKLISHFDPCFQSAVFFLQLTNI